MNHSTYHPKGSPGPGRNPGSGQQSAHHQPSTFRPAAQTPCWEPEVRRWPHSDDAASIPPVQYADLRFLCCSLSYQNQTLSEIKALLEQLTQASGASEK